MYWQNKFRKKTGLFTASEPSAQHVGHLIKLSCGHNGKPTDLEISLLTTHIELADFFKDPSSSSLSPKAEEPKVESPPNCSPR